MKVRLDRKNSDLKDRRLNFPISLTIKPSGLKLKARKSTTVIYEGSPVGIPLPDKWTQT